MKKITISWTGPLSWTLFFCAFLMVSIVLHLGCARNRKVGDFLVDEIASLGGKTNGLNELRNITGTYSLKRDQFGSAVKVEEVPFNALTNAFTKAYGEPINYSPGAADHGPSFLYKNSGIAIFVMETARGVEIDLTTIKP